MSRGKQEQAEGILRKLWATCCNSGSRKLNTGLGGCKNRWSSADVSRGRDCNRRNALHLPAICRHQWWCCTTRRKCSKRCASTDIALLQTIIVGVINLTLHRSGTMMQITVVSHRKLSAHSEWQSACLASVPRFTLRHRVLWRYCRCCLYVAAFAMSWGPVCWVLLSEIFPECYSW